MLARQRGHVRVTVAGAVRELQSESAKAGGEDGVPAAGKSVLQRGAGMGANMQEPGSDGLRRAIIAAGQIPSGRPWAMTRDGLCVYGMQEVRGSNPRSSTSQLNALDSNYSWLL